MRNKTNQVIYAITNLDAEDLGSAIIKTFCNREKAFDERELIESGDHTDFFKTQNLEVFAIELPTEITAALEDRDKRIAGLSEALKDLYEAIDSCIELTPKVMLKARKALLSTKPKE